MIPLKMMMVGMRWQLGVIALVMADWRERLALCIGMWPRGEVGAGVLVLSLGYGIGGAMVTVATFSLALNLVLTGVLILAVNALLNASARAANR